MEVKESFIENSSNKVTTSLSDISCRSSNILFVEPFYGGSHKQLLDTITKCLPKNSYTLVTLPSKKWHWRARCGALMIVSLIPEITTETVLFCSSVLNLAELLGLRPELHKLKKIVYFHENQLVYPVQQIKQRDVQYAYNQIISCLSADKILFNSNFNMESFLSNIKSVVKLLPDSRPKDIREKIESKSTVLYFPLDFPEQFEPLNKSDKLHIVWPHRWEFDKGPEEFYEVLIRLKQNKLNFLVSVLGENFTDNPAIFSKIKQEFCEEIAHFGYKDLKEDYINVLKSAHVVVSTAKHEFFGVSMLEGTYYGCFPLAPNALVYPEILPKTCLYSNSDELYQRLESFCESPKTAIDLRSKLEVDFTKYSSNTLLPDYFEVMNINTK